MNTLTVQDINADLPLSVIIAATFGISVFRPGEGPDIRDCLDKVLQWERYTFDELMANSIIAWNVVCDQDDDKAYLVSSATAETYSDPNAYYKSTAYTAAYVDAAVTAAVASAVDAAANYDDDAAICAAASAAKVVGEDDFIHNSLKLLLPLILNYKIKKSERPFNSPEKVFNLLDDKDKMRFIFNLDSVK